jgi:hypothetical protein
MVFPEVTVVTIAVKVGMTYSKSFRIHSILDQ